MFGLELYGPCQGKVVDIIVVYMLHLEASNILQLGSQLTSSKGSNTLREA
jgi:hypothetical protein